MAWLLSFVGFTLLAWPFTPGVISSAVILAGPAVFGPNDALGAAERIIADLAGAADIAESHTTYVPLVWFRSPGRCHRG